MFASTLNVVKVLATAARLLGTGNLQELNRIPQNACLFNPGISYNLSQCRRIHTGRRPYKCRHDGCNKSFAHKTVLTKHMKSAHGSTASKRSQIQWRPFEAPRPTIELPPSPVPSLASPCCQRDMTPVYSTLPSPIPSPYTLSNESFFGFYERPSFSLPTCQTPPSATTSTATTHYPRRPSFFDIVF